MIENLDVERPAYLVQLPGYRDIFFARARIAAWVIVNEDDRRCIEFERTLEDRPWIDRKLGKRTILELLVGEESPSRVEKQDAQNFGWERSHRYDQILAQLWVEGVDREGAKIAAHCLGHHVARADQQLRDSRTRPENAAEGLR